MALKNVGTPEQKYKARFVAQSNNDPDTIFQIQFASNVKHHSFRIHLTIDASNDDEETSSDVDQAFLQVSKPKRIIYICPSK